MLSDYNTAICHRQFIYSIFGWRLFWRCLLRNTAAACFAQPLAQAPKPEAEPAPGPLIFEDAGLPALNMGRAAGEEVHY